MSMSAEEILQTLAMFFVKKPKGILIMVGSMAVIVSALYFSSVRAQNAILIDSLKVLGSTAQISETIVKKVKEIEAKSDEAARIIDERIKRLDEVEARFHTKREEIRKLREQQDALLEELSMKLSSADRKLDQIEVKQAEQNAQQEMMFQKFQSTPFPSIPTKQKKGKEP